MFFMQPWYCNKLNQTFLRKDFGFVNYVILWFTQNLTLNKGVIKKKVGSMRYMCEDMCETSLSFLWIIDIVYKESSQSLT